MKPDDKRRMGRIVGELVEDFAADAVLIAVTRRIKNGVTETFAVPFGNLHTCKGLAEYVYDAFCEGEHNVDEKEEEEEEE